MKYSILYVIDNLEYGGGERGFAQLACGLDKDKYTVYAACNPGGKFWEKLSEIDTNLRALNMESKFNADNFLKLAKIIKKEGIHIVHSQGLRAEFFVRIATRLLRIRPKVVSTIQMSVEGFDVSPLRNKFYQIFDRISERYVDRFIAVSETIRNMLIDEHKIPEGKVTKIYNGIELEEYEPDYSGELKKKFRMEFDIPENVYLIGAIGRMVWQKGFEFLIRALPEIEKNHSQAKIIIAGDGPQRKRMEELAQHLGVEDKVIFTGFRGDIKKILSAIDVLSIPSLLEGFPMITLEAMAMAKPIIATNIYGIAEQIKDGENGILVPAKDSDALAKSIMKIFSDRDRAESIGLAARKHVEEHFSVEKMIRETEKAYLSLLKV